MKTEWDYTELADAYMKRPDYSDAAIDAMLKIANVREGDAVCDVGAGVAHLTIMLARRGLDVTAVEPNDAMRENGIRRTKRMINVQWYEGVGENTGQNDSSFDLVTFGSSFNVCDRESALNETKRILKPKRWFACMWNHRDLGNPVQNQIEKIINDNIPDYNYGTRREDQTEFLENTGLFEQVIHLDSKVVHVQDIAECVDAWRSHATLERQAGDRFYAIINAIEEYLGGLGQQEIRIPYKTNIWMAKFR